MGGMSTQRLVLFDIDGTLLSAAGAGRTAIRRALDEVVGTVVSAETWSFAGKTDPQIVRELLGLHGLGPEAIEELLPQVLERYLRYLPEAMKAEPRMHLKPGVEAILAELAGHPDVVVALLTGNVEAGARLKLSTFGLWERFAFGAYGCDHHDRPELPAIAVRRAEALTGRRFTGKEIVIIGDTEHDIRCGASLGVKAIAVATGPFPVATLALHRPDHLFADLADTPKVLDAILA